MGLGGLYLQSANPPREGSSIELVFDLPTGQIRARALVRSVKVGKGMGIQFVQMKPEDRARLNQYLSRQEVVYEPIAVSLAADSRPRGSQLIVWPRREEAAQLQFERELSELIALTGKGTYYQLLGVTSETPDIKLKKRYYLLARKYHPDNHTGNPERISSLKNLMVLITEAYRTLASEEKRAAYDKRLADMGAFTIRRGKTGTQESVEDWFKRANDSLRARNFVGSIVWLRKCVEAEPDNAVYRAMLARSLGTMPQYRDEAIEHFRKAIDLDPWREPVYLQFAELFEKMQLHSRACAIYSKLLSVNPAHAKARQRLSALETAQKVKTLRR